MEKKRAIIIGGGPAGLTFAYDLQEKTDITPAVYESLDSVGGISRTINYKGNRMDIGGHRFFSKSDRVMQWWQKILPIQGMPSKDELALDIKYPDKKHSLALAKGGPDPEKEDNVMLFRKRVSRIFFLRKFFDYPVSLNKNTLANLGFARVMKIGASYLRASVFPIKKEKSLEDFFINRFGKELYKTFFRDYTEKVWGVPCDRISPEWGAQRVKGLSITKTITHALKKAFVWDRTISQKKTETSLIEQFMYPKYGPGHLWEKVADKIRLGGGEILTNHEVVGIINKDNTIAGVRVRDKKTGEERVEKADYYISTMPVKDLVARLENSPPPKVKEVASNLLYRDFLTVGVLVRKLNAKNKTSQHTVNDIIPDNWIYVQERDVKIGRIQIFNNWSPYLVKDSDTIFLGLEYFCSEGDSLWGMSDDEIKKFSAHEMGVIGLIDSADVLDSVVIRVPKTYPAYFGSYPEFKVVRDYIDGYENLFLIGRNGMHKYNNQDHSMLTAMKAVENIAGGEKSKDNIWSVNTEDEYHES
jgi:protoporphyrinogen oxidase